MDKEQILSTVNEQLGKTSLSQRTLNDYVSANLPGEGEEFDFDRHVGILKSLNGNFSADMKTAVEDFKKNYKPETSTTDKTEEDDKSVSDALERIAALEKKLAQQATNATVTEIRKSVIDEGKKLKVANNAIWEDAVAAIEVGDNESVSDVTAKAKTAYERMLRRYVGEGAEPYSATGRSGQSKEADEQAKARREEFKKRMKSRGVL